MEETIVKVMWAHIIDKKLLCVRSHGNDTFYTPGGKPNPGESDTDALMREIKEELSVMLKPETITHLHTFVGQAHGKHAGKRLEMRCFTAAYVGELKPASEIEEMRYVTSVIDFPCTSTGRDVIAWLKAADLIV